MKANTQFRFKKTCEECGEAFDAKTIYACYCSGRCRQKAYRARKKMVPEQRNDESVDAGDRSDTSAKPDRKVCPHCGKHFIAKRSDQVFCKTSCRTSSNRTKQTETMLTVRLSRNMKFGDWWSWKDTHSWADAYQICEAAGWVYSPALRRWTTRTRLAMFDSQAG